MSEIRTVCRVCEGVFLEHEIRLKNTGLERYRILCPNRSYARLEPYAFAPRPRTPSPIPEKRRGTVYS